MKQPQENNRPDRLPDSFVLLTRVGVGLLALALLLAQNANNLTFWLSPTSLGLPFLAGPVRFVVAVGILLALAGPTLNVAIGNRYYVSNARTVLRFALVVFQLGVIYALVTQAEIESLAFRDDVIGIVFAGFIIHHFVPRPWRQRVFVALSLLAIFRVTGLTGVATIVFLATILITIAHLPTGFGIRVALMILVCAFLSFARLGLIPGIQLTALWPIIGSLFFFRLVVYMYDLGHKPEKLDVARTGAYLLMLPNVVFPLFPVVDYSTFKRTYYDSEELSIYRRGITWLALGASHMLLYRYLYHHVAIDAASATDVPRLARYLSSNFLLYFRVSGQFHMIVGIMHLFGFRLPPTHHFFFLASSFNDFWRRINIYWKDFMMKIFFYPAFFRLRKVGANGALVLSTMFVVVATWALHSYQWFWIRGTVLFNAPDALFWATLGVFMVVNSLWESSGKGKARKLSTPLRHAITSSKTVAFFVVMSVLWALWTSPSVEEWWLLITRVDVSGKDLAAVLATLAGAGSFYWLILSFRDGVSIPTALRLRTRTLFTGFATTAVVAFVLMDRPEMAARLPVSAAQFISDMSRRRLAQRDQALLIRGYYEQLANLENVNSPLWTLFEGEGETEFEAPENVGGVVQEARQPFLEYELKPGASAEWSWGIMRANRWGMRDQDYSLARQPHVQRVAFLGQSYVMGEGVPADSDFESVFERRLNAEFAQAPGARFEVLNFGYSDRTNTQQLAVLREQVIRFDPQVVVLFEHIVDPENNVLHLSRILAHSVDIPFPFLSQLVKRTGLTPGTRQALARRRLFRIQTEIAQEVLSEFASIARDAGAVPVMVALPLPGEEWARDDAANLLRMGERAGFAVSDLTHIFDGFDGDSLAINPPINRHPNIAGNLFIADRLFDEFVLRASDFGLVPDSTPNPSVHERN